MLTINQLSVTFQSRRGQVHAVRDASIHVRNNSIHGLVGESGCGKSTLGFAVMRHLPRNARINGELLFKGRDLAGLTNREMQTLRGNRIAMIYQDPNTALNPIMPIGRQIEEVLRHHFGFKHTEARLRTVDLLSDVGLPEPDRMRRRYPHELSGGMVQRVVIALALACNPDLLIMDEPTTALDVTTEANILELIVSLMNTTDLAILYITHDMDVIARVADEVTVMYAGETVETAQTAQLFANPSHPYSAALLSCIASAPGSSTPVAALREIPGTVYPSGKEGLGCLFASRCPLARRKCELQSPPRIEVQSGHRAKCFFPSEVSSIFPSEVSSKSRDVPRIHRPPENTNNEQMLLVAENLQRFYHDGQMPPVRAVNNVNFDVRERSVLGLVGESGSGKSTVARIVSGLTPRDHGSLALRGEELAARLEDRTREQNAALSMVFQNPADSLNPKHRAGHSVIRALVKMGGVATQESREAGLALFEAVGLESELFDRLPEELSGGQKQRVALAAAIATKPQLIIADEVVSSLDVSVQAQILNVIDRNRRDTGTSYVFISHDLSVVNYLCDAVCVMYAGHIVEACPTADLSRTPLHPYTEALLSAVGGANPDATGKERIRLTGSVPDLRQEVKGCCFADRCPRKVGAVCDDIPPPKQVSPEEKEHILYCHIPWQTLTDLQSISGGEQE